MVINLQQFSSFRELFLTKLFDKCGLGDVSIDEAVDSMSQYYTEKEETKYGVIGIEIYMTENENNF